MRMNVVKPLGRGRSPGLIRLSLCDTNLGVARGLAAGFENLADVEVIHGDLFNLNCDALVSPANSFGDMSGGIDQRIDNFYQGAAQRETMRRIAERFHGELPVGAATILKLDSRRFPFLVVAPTMRVPSRVSGTINVYLALRAALAAVIDHNRTDSSPIDSLAAPGLGTGVGGMSADEAARQMRAAYDMIVLEGWRSITHPIEAPFALE
jgi:O-acetyl-ADP-ribose deacetylase (regulator of RNase III)